MSHIRLLIRRCFSSKSIQTYQFLRENPLRILVLLIIILFIVYEYQTVLRRTKVQDIPQNLPVNRQELSKNDEENSSEKKKKEYERYCNEWLQSLNTALAEYIERVGHSTEEDGDSELRALSQPLFTKKKLVVWTAELHSGPITDLKSLIGPLGVRFIDHSLDMGHCHQFCNCGAHRGLRILTPKNALMFYNRHIRQFHEAYRLVCQVVISALVSLQFVIFFP